MTERPFLRRGPSGPLAEPQTSGFGEDYQFVEDLPVQATTGGPLTTLSLLTPAGLEGTYRVAFQCQSGSVTATAVVRLVNVTDAVTLCTRDAAIGSQQRSTSGFADVVFAGAPKLFSITLQKTGGPGTARGSEFRIELWRVIAPP